MEDSGIDSGDHNGDPNPKPNVSQMCILKDAPVIRYSQFSLYDNHFNQGSDTSSADSGRSPPRVLPAPTSRQLQRRLEARIEHAKRLHQEYHTTPSLIPIQRLPIPGAKDHQPLVQWDSDDR